MTERRRKRRFDTAGSSSAAPPPPLVYDQEPWPREWEEEPIEMFAHFANPRAAVKSTDCTHREIRNEWDDYDSLFYNEWQKVIIEPTRFIDWATIRRLGLKQDLT